MQAPTWILAATLTLAATSPSAESPGVLPEVTVTAQRIELSKRISSFVNHIAVQELGGQAGLARWEPPPVCPLVSGVRAQDAEFILGRVSQIARSSGVPIGGEQCHANLFILITP